MIVMSKMNDVDVVRRAEVLSEMAGRHANMPGRKWREDNLAKNVAERGKRKRS